MTEVAIGLLGAAATVGVSSLVAGSGFTGRHEHSHREEMIEMRRSTTEFMVKVQCRDIRQEDERVFLDARKECVCAVHQLTPVQTNLYCNYRAIQRANEYHESIESYKQTSWLNLSKKLQKKKEVRRRKGLTRLSNHSLRHLNEVRCYKFCPLVKANRHC
jgi:RPA family protein